MSPSTPRSIFSIAVALVSRRASAVALATIVAIGVVGAYVPNVLGAGQITVFSCHAPNGEQVGNDGWTIARSSETYMSATAACASDGAGAMSLEVGPNPGGYPNGGHISWLFDAPSWASIAKYRVDVAGSGTYSSQRGIAGNADLVASDETDPNYDYRNLGDGAWGASTIERTPPDRVDAIEADASCDGEGGPCPAGTKIASLQLSAASIVLNDSTTPEVSEVEGPLVAGAALQGNATLSFTARDSGPGVYSAWLVLDGAPQPAVPLDSNDGKCVDLGQTDDGTRSFADPQPCAQTTSASLALDTTPLADGSHTLKLLVDDASGNTTVGFDGTITTGDAPVSEGGAESSRSGDGGASGSESGGDRGAPSSSSDTAASSATSGSTSAASAALEHDGARGRGAAHAWRIKLHVRPTAVHRGTRIQLFGAVTTRPRPPRGKLVYLQARSVRACGRRITSQARSVRACGRWITSQARSVRACGRWITFLAVRTRANGSFNARYRFRLGGRHTYQFRALAPAEGDYRNRTGRSRVVTVRESRR